MSESKKIEAHAPFLAAYGITYLWKAGTPTPGHLIRHAEEETPASRREFLNGKENAIYKGSLDRPPKGGGLRSHAVHEVSFELFKGEILALIGPNGSGKSTLLKAVAGILPLKKPGCSGQVKFRGTDFLSMPPAKRAQYVVYAGADLATQFPLTVEEAVMLGRSCRGHGLFYSVSGKDREVVQWAMEKCLCLDLRTRSLDKLSGGERQRVALASALAQGGKVLLLDETLSRVDLNHQALLGALLKELAREGWAIILVAHDINFATEWADRALCLKEGNKIFEGSIGEAISVEKLQILYPETRFVVGTHPQTGTPKIFFAQN